MRTDFKTFISEHVENKRGPFLTLTNTKAMEAVPEKARQLIGTGSTDPSVPPFMTAVAMTEQNFVGLLHVMWEQNGYTKETIDKIKKEPEKFDVEYEVYEGGHGFRLYFVDGVINKDAPSNTKAREAKIPVFKPTGLTTTIDARSSVELAKLDKETSAFFNKLLEETGKAFNVSALNLTAASSKDISDGARNVSIDPLQIISAKAGLRLAFGVVDSQVGKSVAKVEKLHNVDLTGPQQNFVTNKFYVPNFLLGNDTGLFRDKQTHYDFDCLVANDGNPFGMFTAVRKNDQYEGVLISTYNAVLSDLSNKKAQISALEEIIMAIAYSIAGSGRRTDVDTFLDRIIEAGKEATNDELKTVIAWATTFKKDFIYPVLTVRDQEINAVIETVGPDIRKIQRDLDATRDQIVQVGQQMSGLYMKAQELAAQKIGAELMKKDRATALKMFSITAKSVLQNKFVNYFRFSGKKLYVYTNPIKVKVKGGLLFDIGRLVIIVPLEGQSPDQIRFYSLDRRPGNRSIPHAFEGQQHVCWGNQRDNIIRAIDRGDLMSIVNIVIAFATSVSVLG